MMTVEEAQAVLDLIHYGVAGPGRGAVLRALARRLEAGGMRPSRKDFDGLVTFDDPAELPGLQGD
jgi:hypothetical protein